jgi:hypothetical protein
LENADTLIPNPAHQNWLLKPSKESMLIHKALVIWKKEVGAPAFIIEIKAKSRSRHK